MVRQVEDNTTKHGIRLFGLDDPRQGIVHVVGPEQGLTLPGPADRLRRQPHLDPWRAWRLRVRHRRLRSRACADDADDLAEEAAAHAHHRRRRDGAGHFRQRTSRSRSSATSAPTARPAMPRVCRLRDPRAVDRRAADALQHVDRSRRALRHGRARRNDLRLSQGPPLRARRRGFRSGGRSLVEAASGRRRAVRPRGHPRRRRHRADRHLGHEPARTRCRSTPACPIRRARPTPSAPNICAMRSTIWGSRRARS